MARKLLGYLLIAASLVGGVYMVFISFEQWIDNGSGLQLALDGLILVALVVVFIVGYYFATAMEARR